MKRILSPLLLIFLLAESATAQISVSAMLTPRFEHEIRENSTQDGTETALSLSPYLNLFGSYTQQWFFADIGIGYLNKKDQFFNKSSYEAWGGGSGTFGSQEENGYYNFNYSTISAELSVGTVLGGENFNLLIGATVQSEYLIGYETNYGSSTSGYEGSDNFEIDPMKDPSISLGLKVNPRWTIPNQKFFIEFNNVIGKNITEKTHIGKLDPRLENKKLNNYYFETGIGIGYLF